MPCLVPVTVCPSCVPRHVQVAAHPSDYLSPQPPHAVSQLPLAPGVLNPLYAFPHIYLRLRTNYCSFSIAIPVAISLIISRHLGMHHMSNLQYVTFRLVERFDGTGSKANPAIASGSPACRVGFLFSR